MLVLCLDTATADVAVALVQVTPEGSTTRSVGTRRDPRGAGEHLIPLVLETLAATGAVLPDVSALAVGLGPGPFTGLRAGVVTGAVLARTLGIPAYGVCSLDAFAAPNVVATTDARRREVYWAAYDDGARRVAGPAVDRPADLVARVSRRTFVGPGVEVYPDVLGGGASEPSPPYPVARLADLAAGRLLAKAAGEVLVPLYLRRPDAAEPTAARSSIGGAA